MTYEHDYWESNGEEERERIGVEYQYEGTSDFVHVLMTMTINEAKAVIIRGFGLVGDEAADIANLPSKWAFYHLERRNRASMKRKRDELLR
jgi:hypothetical protein